MTALEFESDFLGENKLTKKQFEEVVLAAKSKHVTSLYEADSLSGWSWTLRGREKTPSRNGKWMRTTTFHVLSVVQPDTDTVDPKYIKARRRFENKVLAAKKLFALIRRDRRSKIDHSAKL